jgi:hypothetical protein
VHKLTINRVAKFDGKYPNLPSILPSDQPSPTSARSSAITSISSPFENLRSFDVCWSSPVGLSKAATDVYRGGWAAFTVMLSLPTTATAL